MVRRSKVLCWQRIAGPRFRNVPLHPAKFHGETCSGGGLFVVEREYLATPNGSPPQRGESEEPSTMSKSVDRAQMTCLNGGALKECALHQRRRKNDNSLSM